MDLNKQRGKSTFFSLAKLKAYVEPYEKLAMINEKTLQGFGAVQAASQSEKQRKKNTQGSQVSQKMCVPVQRNISYDWNDSGTSSMPQLPAIIPENKKKSTKPKNSRGRKGKVEKFKNQENNKNATNKSPKQQLRTPATSQNVNLQNHLEVEESNVVKKRISEEELENIRAKRRKWVKTHETDAQWIECCHEKCGKWRLVFEYEDPADVPEIWFCSMNQDPDFATCDVPEEKIPKTVRAELIETKYTIGSIVWARIDGYPWWPAIVDECPDLFKFCQLQGSSPVPIKYHVSFLDAKKPLHAWIRDRGLKPYKKNPRQTVVKRTIFRTIDYKADVDAGCVMADEAMTLTVAQRVERFGFTARVARNKRSQNKSKLTKSQLVVDKYVLKENGMTREEEREREKDEKRFKVGDVVWARPLTFPWWPAMIDKCPIFKNHIRVPKSAKEMNMYHVVYFSEKHIEFDWVSEDKLKFFSKNRRNKLVKNTKIGKHDYKRELNESYNLAMEADQMPLERRLLQYSMSARLKEQLLKNGKRSAGSVSDCSPQYYEDENEFPDSPQSGNECIELIDDELPNFSGEVLTRENSRTKSKISNSSSSDFDFGSSSTSSKSLNNISSNFQIVNNSTATGSSQISSFFFPKPGCSGINNFSKTTYARKDGILSLDSDEFDCRLSSKSNSSFSTFSDDSTKMVGSPINRILAFVNSKHFEKD